MTRVIPLLLLASVVALTLSPNLMLPLVASSADLLQPGRTVQLSAYAAVVWEDQLRNQTLLVVLTLTVWLFSLFRAVWVPTALLVLPCLLAPLEVFYILNFGAASNAHVLGLVQDTNLEEAGSWLGWDGVRVVALALAAGALALVAAWRLRRDRVQWRHWSRPAAFAAGSVALTLWLLPDVEAMARPAPVDAATSEFRWANSLVAAQRWHDTYPYGIYFRVQDLAQQRRNIRLRTDVVAQYPLPVSADTQQALQVVVVIGESVRRDHWGLYGYSRNTTPWMQAQDGLMVFDNVISDANATRISVPQFLAPVPVDGMNPVPMVPSVISALKAAGFWTQWVSTHQVAGPHDNPIAAVASEADRVTFVNAGTYSYVTLHDEVVLPPFDEGLRREPRAVHFLHLLGSHHPYQRRYPEPFGLFQPAPAAGERVSLRDRHERERLVNAYDNSIVYTDHLLHQVVRRLEASGQPAIMIYTSDHGQTFFDGRCEQAGHGFASRPNFEVPFVVWASPAYRQAFPHQVAFLEARRGDRLSLRDGFRLMAAAAGVDLSGLPRAPGWRLDDAPHEPRRVITGNRGTLDFDSEAFQRVDCAAQDPS